MFHLLNKPPFFFNVKSLLMVLVCLASLVGTPAFAEPSASVGSFVGLAKPRYPIHFVEGNGFNPPTTLQAVRKFAVANGVFGMGYFTEDDWLDIDGHIVTFQRENGTKFFLEIKGLVPGGLYTAWLVRKTGSPLGSKADLDLGNGYLGRSGKKAQANVIFADSKGAGHLRVSLSNDFVDANGQAFVNLDQWDEIHIAFHADNNAHGATPGPNHWTQMVFPIR